MNATNQELVTRPSPTTVFLRNYKKSLSISPTAS